ncbi:MAG: hypothetical protein WAQ41_02305 [bacterium]|nr:hypothetical protein [Bacillota bacterium]
MTGGEKKKCSRCGLVLTSADLLRCPRCQQLLYEPGCKGNCSSCGSGMRTCLVKG